jgi:curved DNA-binding protein
MMVAARMMDPRRARAVLGLRGSVDDAALRAAFRQAVKAAHPDRPGGDAAKLREVVEAYGLLKATPAAAPAPASVPPPAKPVADSLEISPALAASGGRAFARLADGRRLAVELPAGLRPGDKVRAGEAVLTVTVKGGDGLILRGDDLWLSAHIPHQSGGRLPVATPAGPREIWIGRRDIARGLVRLTGQGLPARGPHAAGDLIVTLKAPPTPPESGARSRLRAFQANWAPAPAL